MKCSFSSKNEPPPNQLDFILVDAKDSSSQTIFTEMMQLILMSQIT